MKREIVGYPLFCIFFNTVLHSALYSSQTSIALEEMDVCKAQREYSSVPDIQCLQLPEYTYTSSTKWMLGTDLESPAIPCEIYHDKITRELKVRAK